MALVNEIGWMCGFFNRPIQYNSSYLNTIQDYVKYEKVTTTIYNSTLQKKHTITLAVPTNRKKGFS